ncbi:hypothetical protein FA13DRAFT_1716398 [Coprinellus micaceus]|uniref:F-box domain-containing protein n=1 Tax=Coprinellus micaceus TaxID=71717 RepID=A0A4Y7SJ77_COPMI|nr:hypothetical protein FA13DRAFT_1716398 [Coprinellus micaceus]
MSSQFAFLSLRLLKLRPKRHQQTKPPGSPQRPVPAPLSFPAEILHSIFSFAVEASSSDVDLVEKNNLRAAAFALSQLLPDFLQLSRPHPIDVGHRSSPFRVAVMRDFAILPLLKQERRRIREWNVEIFTDYHQSRIVAAADNLIFPLHQPSLAAIRATGECPSLVWNIHKLSGSLRNLCLRELRVVFPLLPSLGYTHLTELSVDGVAMEIRPVESEWLALLQGMPQLQLLSLHDTIRLDPSWQPLSNTELPQLRLLSLRDADWSGVRALRRVFSRLLLPATCGVDLNLPSTSRFKGSQSHLNDITTSIWRALRRHLGGPVLADLSPTDIPQVEFGLYANAGRFWTTIGTVRHPDTSLDWNGQPGTSGVVRRLDAHASAHPRFPTLNISFEGPSTADFDLLLLLAEPLLPRAKRLRIYMDRISAFPSTKDCFESRVISSLMARMPQVFHTPLGHGLAAPINDSLLATTRHQLSSEDVYN